MNSELRIIHVITNLKMGGAERLTIDICTKLAENPNIKVALVLLENEIEYELPDTFPIYILKNKCQLSIKKRNRFDNSEFERIILDFKPEIIHSHLFESEIISRFTIYNNIRYFTHIHDNIRQFKPKFDLSKKRNITELYERNWIYKRYKKTNNKFISISKDTTNFSVKYLPNKIAENIFYLPNAIDTKKFISHTKSSNEKLKLLSIGSLVHKKNHRFLIEVVSRLIQQNQEVELIIIGEGKLKAELQAQIDKLNLNEHIHLIGNQKNIPGYLNNSDIYVHSATYEPFGLVLLEAMASGTPVVSLNGQGNKELITNYENGFILDEPNVESFIEKILELHKDPNLYAQFQKNGIEFSQQFDIKNYAVKLINIYKS